MVNCRTRTRTEDASTTEFATSPLNLQRFAAVTVEDD